MLGRRSFLKSFGFASLLPLTIAGRSSSQPPPRRVHLIDIFVAGFQYYDGMRDEVARSLQVGNEVLLKREPENKYDENAIEVYTLSGYKLGYLPRSDNTVIAAIADQDIEIGAELCLVDLKATPWERVAVSVFQVISTSDAA
jgi:hypothetical protein